jgi:hypothetical protein
MTRGVVNDLTGKRFGNLTVVGRAPSDRQNNAQWSCMCGCGNNVNVRGGFLLKGQQFCSKQCTLYRAHIVNEVAGQTFGKLTAIRRVGFTTTRKAVWEFSCACGNAHVTVLDLVLSGNTTSCGCFGTQRRKTRDGLSTTRAYKNAYWHAYMRRRSQASLGNVPDDAMVAIYAKAKQLSGDTGIPHEVDHVIPLRGKLVSGLHVVANLQVVPRAENRRKSKRFALS